MFDMLNNKATMTLSCSTGSSGTYSTGFQKSSVKCLWPYDEAMYKLDICVQKIRMPPPSALRKIALWFRYWLLSDNYRSIKADLYNIVETNEGPCRSKRLAFSLQSNLGY